MSKWISVDERPVPNRMVLAIMHGDFEFAMTINSVLCIHNGRDWREAKGKVTHWMPLPPPPAAEK